MCLYHIHAGMQEKTELDLEANRGIFCLSRQWKFFFKAWMFTYRLWVSFLAHNQRGRLKINLYRPIFGTSFSRIARHNRIFFNVDNSIYSNRRTNIWIAEKPGRDTFCASRMHCITRSFDLIAYSFFFSLPSVMQKSLLPSVSYISSFHCVHSMFHAQKDFGIKKEVQLVMERAVYETGSLVAWIPSGNTLFLRMRSRSGMFAEQDGIFQI